MVWFKKGSRGDVTGGDAAAGPHGVAEHRPGVQPRVIDVHAWRLLHPGWEAKENRSQLNAEAYSTASAFVDALYEDLLADLARPGDKVIFLLGGPGSLKTTIRLGMTIPEGAILYDGLPVDFGPALARIDVALASGRDVEVHYLYREPGPAAWATLVRATRDGRIVMRDDLVEGHKRANDLALGCEDHPSLEEVYARDPRVQLHYWRCLEPDDDAMGIGFSLADESPPLFVPDADRPERVYHWASLPSRDQERSRQIELGLSGDALEQHLASYEDDPHQVWVETFESVSARLIPVFAGPFRPLWERDGYDEARGY